MWMLLVPLRTSATKALPIPVQALTRASRAQQRAGEDKICLSCAQYRPPVHRVQYDHAVVLFTFCEEWDSPPSRPTSEDWIDQTQSGHLFYVAHDLFDAVRTRTAFFTRTIRPSGMFNILVYTLRLGDSRDVYSSSSGRWSINLLHPRNRRRPWHIWWLDQCLSLWWAQQPIGRYHGIMRRRFDILGNANILDVRNRSWDGNIGVQV